MKKFFVLGTLASLAAFSPAFSLYNFESLAMTSGAVIGHPGAYTSVSQTDDGLTLMIYRSSQDGFDIYDNASIEQFSAYFPLQWHSRCLDPFVDATLDDWFVGNFSQGVRAVEIEMTDFGGDGDTLQMDVWSGLDGTGNLLASRTLDWAASQSSPNWGAVGWNGPNSSARSITFRGGSVDFPNSMYIDNIAALKVVPEPAGIATLAVGLAAVLRRRKA